MAYTAWSVVFGEQPTAAKWNQLGANDAGFKDGTNIDDDAIISRHIGDSQVLAQHLGVPIAFAVELSADQTVSALTFVRVNWTAEIYDLGNCFDPSTDRFTAPYDGVYQFNWVLGNSGTAQLLTALYKNGVLYKRGLWANSTASNQRSSTGSYAAKLNAGDYIELYGYTDSTTFRGTGGEYTHFSGFLVGRA